MLPTAVNASQRWCFGIDRKGGGLIFKCDHWPTLTVPLPLMLGVSIHLATQRWQWTCAFYSYYLNMWTIYETCKFCILNVMNGANGCDFFDLSPFWKVVKSCWSHSAQECVLKISEEHSTTNFEKLIHIEMSVMWLLEPISINLLQNWIKQNIIWHYQWEQWVHIMPHFVIL